MADEAMVRARMAPLRAGQRAGPMLLLAGLAVGLMRPAAAGGPGIATTFVEVLAEGVPVASRYVVQGKPLDAWNKGLEPVHLRFDAEVPPPSLMRAGYEPVPDAAWIGFEPREADASPGTTVYSHAVIYVPDDASLVGKRFQAMVRIHPTGPTPGGVAVALLTRLEFTVAPKGSPPAAVRLSNSPQKLAVAKPYETGGRADRLVAECSAVSLENEQDEDMMYDFEPVPDGPLPELKPGESRLDPAWVEPWPRTVLLPPRQKAEIAVRVTVPVAAGLFGRTLVGPLQFTATRRGYKPVRVRNAVRVVIPELPAPWAMTRTGSGGSQ